MQPLVSFEAQQVCSLLTNSSDVFKPCIDAIDSEQYYISCMWDYCLAIQGNNQVTMETVKCKSYEAMSRECVENYLIIPWRSTDRCG